MREISFAAVIAAGIVLFTTVACTAPDTTKRILEQSGYTDVETTGYAFFACDSKTDTFATGFKATGPIGKRVTGAVCSGWLKNSTIRFD